MNRLLIDTKNYRAKIDKESAMIKENQLYLNSSSILTEGIQEKNHPS